MIYFCEHCQEHTDLQVEYSVPVSVIVRMELDHPSPISRVIVWDELLSQPGEVACAECGLHLTATSPAAAKAIAIAQTEGLDWPAWQFGV